MSQVNAGSASIDLKVKPDPSMGDDPLARIRESALSLRRILNTITLPAAIAGGVSATLVGLTNAVFEAERLNAFGAESLVKAQKGILDSIGGEGAQKSKLLAEQLRQSMEAVQSLIDRINSPEGIILVNQHLALTGEGMDTWLAKLRQAKLDLQRLFGPEIIKASDEAIRDEQRHLQDLKDSRLDGVDAVDAAERKSIEEIEKRQRGLKHGFAPDDAINALLEQEKIEIRINAQIKRRIELLRQQNEQLERFHFADLEVGGAGQGGEGQISALLLRTGGR